VTTERGWLAVDPKGVVGEVEYEMGALLRNPVELPDILTSPAIIERRIDAASRRLGLDAARVLRWAFAQAVLSAIWMVEDGGVIDVDAPIRVARVLGG
jgi:streptomycin 6-kinase